MLVNNVKLCFPRSLSVCYSFGAVYPVAEYPWFEGVDESDEEDHTDGRSCGGAIRTVESSQWDRCRESLTSERQTSFVLLYLGLLCWLVNLCVFRAFVRSSCMRRSSRDFHRSLHYETRTNIVIAIPKERSVYIFLSISCISFELQSQGLMALHMIARLYFFHVVFAFSFYIHFSTLNKHQINVAGC